MFKVNQNGSVVTATALVAGSQAEDIPSNSGEDATVADTNPPPKKAMLFANKSRTSQTSGVRTESTAADEFTKFINECVNTDECLPFWEKNKVTYSKLIPAVLRIFPVPASNAPVERVFTFQSWGSFLSTSSSKNVRQAFIYASIFEVQQ